MSSKFFRVAYIDTPMYQSFNELLDAAPGLETAHINPAWSDTQKLDVLASCQGYYVCASRDELPRQWHVTKQLLDSLPLLRLASSYGAGYDTIDVDACTAAGVLAVNQAGGNAQGVAEHAVGMMITLLKRIPEAQHAMRAGTVDRREALMGRELSGKTIGIVGMGFTGTHTAAILNAFGCRVLAYDPYLDARICAERHAEKAELSYLLETSDVIDLHCPLTAETRGLFGAREFAAMRRGSLFINTARGSIYDEAALYDALSSGHLSAAGLDVWEQEPPPKNHPLLTLPNVLASPHTAGVTHESRDRVARMAAQSFIDLAAGKTPRGVLNPSVLANATTQEM
jgi:D-3-phosphoglycerate dehydrogenase